MPWADQVVPKYEKQTAMCKSTASEERYLQTKAANCPSISHVTERTIGTPIGGASGGATGAPIDGAWKEKGKSEREES